jgi:hypothetical protein
MRVDSGRKGEMWVCEYLATIDVFIRFSRIRQQLLMYVARLGIRKRWVLSGKRVCLFHAILAFTSAIICSKEH